MNPDKHNDKDLYDVWILCKSKSSPGREYYFNKKNGNAFWTEPEVVDIPSCSKKSNQVEKKNIPEQNKKDETRKRGQKRKRNRHAQKTEKEVPQKVTKSTVVSRNEDKYNHMNKSANTSKVPPPQKRKLKKNLANNRLSDLRHRLSLDVEKDNTTASVAAKRVRSSPSSAHEATNKICRTELKSPNVNDSKCTITSQSPSSDSLQSAPYQSQFFTANKIISSMKAQLPENYDDNERQRDNFADIEQGICNQMSEYPSNKHISTPPQFSEATKLVSAIKSRLAYKKAGSHEDNVGKPNSAEERMQILRTGFGAEASETSAKSSFNDTFGIQDAFEPMEVEDTKEPVRVKSETTKVIETSQQVGTLDTNVVLVVDTNVFIRELQLLKNLLNSHMKGYSEQPTLLIPWRVINELDRLKDNNNGNSALCKRARYAMDFLYNSIPENNRVRGQSLRDANSHIYPCEVPDDEILNCCLQQAERGKSVVLLSNDKNLCNKATVNSIRRMSISDLKPLLECKPQAVVDPKLRVSVDHYENTMYQLLANILENEMRAKYVDLWLRVVYKPPPWNLLDVVQALLKHWMAVFHEVFPRIQNLFNDLERSLAFIKNKKPEALSQSEVNNFKELCVEIAKKCQIIPEYMELAKRTVQRLVYGNEGETDCAGATKAVVDAFETVWTVFSSYCAKLGTSMGIPHSIEDQLPENEAVEGLMSKWGMFRNHINSLCLALTGVLSVESSDVVLEEHVSRLEAALKSGLTLIASDGAVIVRDELRIFCVQNRDMLKKACIKLSQLTEMLDICKLNMKN